MKEQKKSKNRLKQNKGITLIALVITIIVLLILAGVSISAITGSESAMEKAKQAKTANENANELEEVKLAVVNSIAQGLTGTVDVEKLGTILGNDYTVSGSGNNITVQGKTSAGKTGIIYNVSANGSVKVASGVSISLPEGVTEAKLVAGGTGTIVLKGSLSADLQGTGKTIAWSITSGDDKISLSGTTGESVTVSSKTGATGGTAQIKAQTNDGTGESSTITVKIVGSVAEASVGTAGTIKAGAGSTVNVASKITNKEEIEEISSYALKSDSTSKGSINATTGVLTINSGLADNTVITVILTGATTGSTKEITITIGENYITDDYTWNELSQIAKKISDGASDITITQDNTDANDVDNKITKVEGTINSKAIELNVGDKAQVTWNGALKVVRILGFKHDDLTSASAYGGTNTKAGISFEFVDLLEDARMNASNNNTGGWGKTEIRGKLNDEDNTTGTYIAKLTDQTASDTTTKMTQYIKAVDKKYLKTYNGSDVVTPKQMSTTDNTITAGDKLWLLSCSEIWATGYQANAYGYCKQKEGEQYRYYKQINATWDSSNDKLKKPNINSPSIWWLRSPSYKLLACFCNLSLSGCSYNFCSESRGVAPGFAI